MDNEYYKNEAMHIVEDLCDEFNKEEKKLKIKYDNNCSRLEEMDHQIHVLSRTEDIEMRVFSPRKHISSETDKVASLKSEREILDKTNREVERDLRYYSKRAEKLRYLLDVLTRNEELFFENEENQIKDNNITEVKQNPSGVSVSDLEKIQSRLDSCYHFIDGDPKRAKMELKNLMILLTDLIVKND